MGSFLFVLCPSTASNVLWTVWMHVKRECMQFQGVTEETEVLMEVAWKFDFLFARSWSLWSSPSEFAQFVQPAFKSLQSRLSWIPSSPFLTSLYFGSTRNLELLYCKPITASSLHMCLKIPSVFLYTWFFYSYCCVNKLTIMYFFFCIFEWHLWLCSLDKTPQYEDVWRLTDPK